MFRVRASESGGLGLRRVPESRGTNCGTRCCYWVDA